MDFPHFWWSDRGLCDVLLAYNGFTIEHKFGDFIEPPYGPDSPKQIIICRKT